MVEVSVSDMCFAKLKGFKIARQYQRNVHFRKFLNYIRHKKYYKTNLFFNAFLSELDVVFVFWLVIIKLD